MLALRIITESLRGLVEWLITPIPGPPGFAIRWVYYKLLLADLGWGTLIDVGVRFENPRSISIGRKSWIDRNVLIIGAVPDPLKGRPGRWLRQDPAIDGKLVIGNYTHIAPNVTINGLSGAYIGDKVGIASGARVYSLSHNYENAEGGWAAFTPLAPKEEQYLLAGSVYIADKSGVGLNAVVLPAARLAEGSFLGAQAMLIGRTEEYTLYAGIPAKPVVRS